MTTFNSCTKCVGRSGITHARAPNCYPVFWSWTFMDDLTLNLALISKLRGSLVCSAYFLWHVIHGCLYNQALAGARSTGAGIKYLYCSYHVESSEARSRETTDRHHNIYLPSVEGGKIKLYLPLDRVVGKKSYFLSPKTVVKIKLFIFSPTST